MSVSGTKILFLVTEDWYFCSHRLPIARAARDAGFEVLVATRTVSHATEITREGFGLIPIKMKRGKIGLLGELASIRELIGIYRREKPDIVHHVAMKPVLYGSVAAALTGVPATINTLAGLGFIFTARGIISSVLRKVIRLFLKLALTRRNTHVIVQNTDDRRVVESLGVSAGLVRTIRSSGVDLQRFTPRPEPDGPIVVTMVSRMLWDKGVGELVTAARELRAQDPTLSVKLVGAPDPENPASIPVRQLREWCDEGVIDWLGHREDIPAIWAGSHIAVLPSYREGLPKSLVEAAAGGRPMIATDAPGCRELVSDGFDGILVPVRDSRALAAAIQKLAEDADLRRYMGTNARGTIERGYGNARVSSETVSLYRDILAHP